MIYQITLKELVVNVYKVEASNLDQAINMAMNGDDIIDHYTIDHIEQSFVRADWIDYRSEKEIKKEFIKGE